MELGRCSSDGSSYASTDEDETSCPRSLSSSPISAKGTIARAAIQNITKSEFSEILGEDSLGALTDGDAGANGPRSISPRPSSEIIGRRANVAIQNATTVAVETSSASSNDTGPISLDPNHKPSQYATGLIKAYRNHLKSTLADSEDFNERQGEGAARSSVTSMKYCNSMLGLYGFYFGQVDIHFIPDGNGILCSHDGQLLEGQWRRGEFVGNNSNTSKNIEFNYSSSTCDTSTCSSLSASVTCNFLRLPDPGKRVIPKVPKRIYIPAQRKSVHWPDTQFYFKQNNTQRKLEP